jgi:hypothetical protein
MNLIVNLCRTQNNAILDLQVVDPIANKENLPPAPDPQIKNQHHSWIECFQKLEKACGQMKH